MAVIVAFSLFAGQILRYAQDDSVRPCFVEDPSVFVMLNEVKHLAHGRVCVTNANGASAVAAQILRYAQDDK
jgi:hypothetical protein